MLLDAESLPTACAITDASGAVLAANEELGRLTDMPVSDLVGQNLEAFLSAGSKVFFQTHIWPLLRKEGVVREVFVYLKSRAGEVRSPLYINAKRTGLASDGHCVWLFFSADERTQFEAELISARKQAEVTAQQIRDAHDRMRELHAQLQDQVADTEVRFQQASELAQKDSLTLLGNRRSLQEAANRLRSETIFSSKFSVLMVDIDNFKLINDQHGHGKGDEVLVDVAQCLLSLARQGDVVVRYGGEEFCLVLLGADRGQATAVAERVRQQLSDCKPGGIKLTASVGVATSQDSFDDLFVVLAKADGALYSAKRNGRNQCVHAESMKSL